MRRCKECGTALPCITQNGLCKECDQQFAYCYYKCKYPCRDREEQKEIFDRVNKGWDEPEGGKA